MVMLYDVLRRDNPVDAACFTAVILAFLRDATYREKPPDATLDLTGEEMEGLHTVLAMTEHCMRSIAEELHDGEMWWLAPFSPLHLWPWVSQLTQSTLPLSFGAISTGPHSQASLPYFSQPQQESWSAQAYPAV